MYDYICNIYIHIYIYLYTISLSVYLYLKHCHLLHIKPNPAETFQNSPILAFHQNKTAETLLVPN